MCPRTFFADSKCAVACLYEDGSEQLAAAIRELDGNQEELNRIFEYFDIHGFGMTLADKSLAGKWAVILPDASAPGMYRYQIFSASGFLSHHTFATVDQAIFDAYNCGFRHLAPMDTLDKLSDKPEWNKGMAVAAVIHDINSGRLSMISGLNALRAIATEGKFHARRLERG